MGQSGGGGLPPEFAHIFGNLGPQRRRGGGHNIFEDLFEGSAGGASFTFTSMGPGGSKVFYSSSGGGDRKRT